MGEEKEVEERKKEGKESRNAVKKEAQTKIPFQDIATLKSTNANY